MRTRLILSFSVPVLAVMLLVLAGVHSILLSGSESQVLSTARSSYDQAYELATSYIELMLYASDSIYYNGDLQRILSSRDYLEEMPAADRYREFLVLDDVFSMAENVELIYRTGIYLNSEISVHKQSSRISCRWKRFSSARIMRGMYSRCSATASIFRRP